jgi:hypothetical protein
VAIAFSAATARADDSAAVAPFAATPMPVVHAMLELASVGPSDHVIDLGSGDGRLVITAVKQFGARGGTGVDIDESLVDYANRKAAEDGVGDRAKFYVRDLFVTDVRPATVVTIYLLPIAMDRLERKLAAELAPGTRVVSHDYPLRGWRAERVIALDVPEKTDYTGRRNTAVYLYVVPPKKSTTPQWKHRARCCARGTPSRSSSASSSVRASTARRRWSPASQGTRGGCSRCGSPAASSRSSGRSATRSSRRRTRTPAATTTSSRARSGAT